MSGVMALDADRQLAMVITAAGGPEVLQPRREPVPTCGPQQVLIEVAAAGVNRHDVNQRRRGPDARHSDIPGLEVAGRIVAVGEYVTHRKPGDTVCALVDGGGYASYAVADASLTLPVPHAMTMIEASALPEALFTTWHNFFTVARLQAGERVLIHGGTSGVGSIAIQLLSAFGHEVYATCGTDEKCETARSLGARAAFNYRTEDFARRTLEATGQRGVDVILDMAGVVHAEANIVALARRGRIVHLSPGGGADMRFPLRALMQKEGIVTGSLLLPLPLDEKAVIAAALADKVWPRLGTQIRPMISCTLPLAQAAQAHQRLEEGDVAGKIVLLPQSLTDADAA
jgi:putative PIG3 family NAD(P)H quinone oxidoreductase